MKSRVIIYHGKPVVLACDGKCNRAWGISNRPKAQLSADEDDIEYLADHEAGEAPPDPGTYEGGHAKPQNGIVNKWCARECERSVMVRPGDPVALPNFTERIRNKAAQHAGAEEEGGA